MSKKHLRPVAKNRLVCFEVNCYAHLARWVNGVQLQVHVDPASGDSISNIAPNTTRARATSP
jgi:hypothetical protein